MKEKDDRMRLKKMGVFKHSTKTTNECFTIPNSQSPPFDKKTSKKLKDPKKFTHKTIPSLKTKKLEALLTKQEFQNACKMSKRMLWCRKKGDKFVTGIVCIFVLVSRVVVDRVYLVCVR